MTRVGMLAATYQSDDEYATEIIFIGQFDHHSQGKFYNEYDINTMKMLGIYQGKIDAGGIHTCGFLRKLNKLVNLNQSLPCFLVHQRQIFNGFI
jgi:hypothetical protein